MDGGGGFCAGPAVFGGRGRFLVSVRRRHAASGLLLLQRLLPAERGAMYGRAAELMLESLAGGYTSRRIEEDGIVLQATGSYPTGKNIGMPLIYGDYFYMEALSRLLGRQDMFW